MANLVVKTHDFEVAKQRLKDFSQKQAKDLELDTVRTDGGFLGLGDHKVTGYELNNRLSSIQGHLIDLNSANNKTIKEFRQVYETFEILDRDYIQGIVASVKATEKTSEKLHETQEDLKKVVENQKKTLEMLKKFKQKLDGYAHLGDIDQIWNDCQRWYVEITSLADSLSEALSTGKENSSSIEDISAHITDTSRRVSQISDSLGEQIERIEVLLSFKNELEGMSHLMDIDNIWASLKDAHDSLLRLGNELNDARTVADRQQQLIDKLMTFVEATSKYAHLKDIDSIWDNVEKHGRQLTVLEEQSHNTIDAVHKNAGNIADLSSYRNHLMEIIHLDDVDSLWKSNEQHSEQIETLRNQNVEALNWIQINKERADLAIADTNEKAEAMWQHLSKKIQYAYWIAGGSLFLALVELLVILLR